MSMLHLQLARGNDLSSNVRWQTFEIGAWEFCEFIRNSRTSNVQRTWNDEGNAPNAFISMNRDTFVAHTQIMNHHDVDCTRQTTCMFKTCVLHCVEFGRIHEVMICPLAFAKRITSECYCEITSFMGMQDHEAFVGFAADGGGPTAI